MKTFNRVVTNIDDVVKTFKKPVDYIKFCGLIYEENEACTEKGDLPIVPVTVKECDHYIETYCGNLNKAI